MRKEEQKIVVLPEEPIMFFETVEEACECARYWTKKLFLEHWHIAIRLTDGEVIPGLGGESSAQWVNCCGTIDIRKKDQMNDAIVRQPHELILVHELLHFKFMGFEQDRPTIEGLYWDTLQHQLLEQMAKALIMTKYNVDFDWFFNC